MIYLFLQTWAWIIGAFILGLCFGWWLCGRCRCATKADNDTEGSATVITDGDIDVEDGWQPAGLTAKPKDADDLKRIGGVGPVIEKTLNGLGIYHFQQIADFTRENIAWVDDHISFPGRIDREDWVGQAKALAAGKETEFSKKVDKGEVDY